MITRPYPLRRVSALLIALAFSAAFAAAQYRNQVEAAVAQVVGCAQAMMPLMQERMRLAESFLPSLGVESLAWLQAENEVTEIQVRQTRAVNDLLEVLVAEGVVTRDGWSPTPCG